MAIIKKLNFVKLYRYVTRLDYYSASTVVHGREKDCVHCVQWSPLGNGKVTIIYKVTTLYWFDCISLLYVWPNDRVKRFLKVLTSD